MATYKVEPYVVAADVYALSPHTGRGGWTWYTGSAGWMYRLITESLLGLRLEVDRCTSSHAFPPDGQASRCTTGIARRCITSRSCKGRGTRGSRSTAKCGRATRFRWWTTGGITSVEVRLEEGLVQLLQLFQFLADLVGDLRIAGQ